MVKGNSAEGQVAFDPGNWVYAQALSLLCHQSNRSTWNDETKGDICEALLALYDNLISANSVLENPWDSMMLYWN